MRLSSKHVGLLIVFGLFFTSCATGFKLNSGSYHLSLDHPAIIEDATKQVTLTVMADGIRLSSEDSTAALTGVLVDDELSLKTDSASHVVRLSGKLMSDNHVEGSITQISENGETLKSGFTLEAIAP